MGFYSKKIDRFSRMINLNAEDMAKASADILKSKEEKIQNLELDLRVYSRMGMNANEFLVDETRDLLEVEKMNYDFLKTLSPVDMIQFMIYAENYNLVKMQENLSAEKDEHSKKLSNYQNKKGFLGKTSVVFGQNQKMIDKNSALVEKSSSELSVVEDSKAEWNSLAPENQAMYIVGRIELEGLAEFDKKGYEDYKNITLNTKQNNNEKEIFPDIFEK